MSPEDFERLQALVATRTGNRLRRDRLNLAEHRLGPVARRAGFHLPVGFDCLRMPAGSA